MTALRGPLATSKGVRLFSTDALWVGLQVCRGVRATRAIQKELAPKGIPRKTGQFHLPSSRCISNIRDFPPRKTVKWFLIFT